MTESRVCLRVSVPQDTTSARLRGVFDGFLDYTFGLPGPGNPEKGNPLPPAVPVALNTVDFLLESGLVEEAGKVVKSLLREPNDET